MSCTTLQILHSIESGKPFFRTLQHLKFRGAEGEPLCYIAGNGAIIFKVWRKGLCCGLKCYSVSSCRRKAIYGDALHHKELYVSLDNGCDWVDVALTEWVEGETLLEYLKKLTTVNNSELIGHLSAQFDRLALRQLADTQKAHGDISINNIIVDKFGEPHLIDFDSAFVPQLEGKHSIELGNAAFQHPLRTLFYFDMSIDDYSLALLSTALSQLALDCSPYYQFVVSGGLLYSPEEILRGRSKSLALSIETFAKAGDALSHAIAKLLYSPVPALPELQALLRLKVEGIDANLTPATPFCQDSLWGYRSSNGREVIPPLFEVAMPFNEGLAAVRLGSYWHYINPQLGVVLNCHNAERIKSIRNGMARKFINGAWYEEKNCF